MSRLSFLHSDQFLPVQSELGMFGLLLAFVVEAGWMLWFRFHVSFHVLLWKTLLACFAVAWRHRGVEFVAPSVLRLWHGLRLLPMVGSEVSVQRTGARWRAQLRGVPESSEIQEMFKPFSRESRERLRALARRFKLSKFRHRPQAAGPIRAPVRGGAPPARLVFHVTKNNLFLPLY